MSLIAIVIVHPRCHTLRALLDRLELGAQRSWLIRHCIGLDRMHEPAAQRIAGVEDGLVDAPLLGVFDGVAGADRDESDDLLRGFQHPVVRARKRSVT